MMDAHKITNPVVGIVCDMRINPAAITAKMTITNGLGTCDHVEKPAGKYEAAKEQRKANQAARLKNWLVCVWHIISPFLHHSAGVA